MHTFTVLQQIKIFIIITIILLMTIIHVALLWCCGQPSVPCCASYAASTLWWAQGRARYGEGSETLGRDGDPFWGDQTPAANHL